MDMLLVTKLIHFTVETAERIEVYRKKEGLKGFTKALHAIIEKGLDDSGKIH